VWEIGDKIVLCGSLSFKQEDEYGFNKPVEINFSPDSSVFAVRYLMESSFVYKLPNMKMLDPLGDLAGGVTVYNSHNGEPYLTIPPHFSEISGLAFSYDNSFLAICDRDKLVSVWEISGKQKVYAKKMEYQLREVIFEQSGRYLAALDFEARHIALIDRNVPNNIMNLSISRIWGHNVTVQTMCFKRNNI